MGKRETPIDLAAPAAEPPIGQNSLVLVQSALSEVNKVSAGMAGLTKLYGNVVYAVSTTLGMAEAKAAREVFISSATTIAMPIVEIDGATIANGHPGSITLSLRQAFFDVAEKIKA